MIQENKGTGVLNKRRRPDVCPTRETHLRVGDRNVFEGRRR